MWLPGLAAGSGPAPVLEHGALEGAELGHPHEADEVATMGQVSVAGGADQPAMLGPVEPAMEEVVELGAGQRLAVLAEDRVPVAAGALALEGLRAVFDQSAS